jgi:eukaryotic-like serine/threonine-protein kinase
VYSLGAILFACLAGRPQIVADTVMQTLMHVVHNPAPSVRVHRPETPVDLETIIAKCLEKSPTKRYPFADRLADDLDAFLEGRPIAARPRSMLHKAWHWFEGVPLVAAILGRRLMAPSLSHRRFQACLLGLLMLSPMILAIGLTVINQSRQAMPRRVVFAGGLPGGVYDDLAERLASRLSQMHSIETDCISSSGSLDNRARLLARDVTLAPMQASAVNDERICVVAPLFYEAVHLLARVDSSVASISQFAGHRCAVGPDGSGSRIAAELVFDSFGLTPDVLPRVVTPWDSLGNEDGPDVAVICIGRGSQLVGQLLTSGRWKLLPLEDGIRVSLQHPTLRPMTISADEYVDASLPELGIDTVGTTAFLAAQWESPNVLIEATLDALYQTPEIIPGLIPLERAAEWQGLAMHPAARRFYQRKSLPEENALVP